MFSWPFPYSAHSSRFLFLTASPWPSSPLSSVRTHLWAVSHETSQRLSSVSPELYTSLLFCLLTSKRLFMANPYFPERPSAHTCILLKACPVGHPPSATFFSLWLVLHCFLLVHDFHTLLSLNSQLEVGERMRNRNIRERSLIMRIGTSLYGDQEVLLSSQDKLETQESGWVLQLWLWRPENQGSHCVVRAVQSLKIRSSNIHGQEKVDVLAELNSPFVYTFVLSMPSESWVLLTQQMRGYLILILITSRKRTLSRYSQKYLTTWVSQPRPVNT